MDPRASSCGAPRSRRLDAMSARTVRSSVLVLLLVLVGCGARAPAPGGRPAGERGMATWYGPRHHGGPTASGEGFDMRALTAAHRTLPFGTRVRVTNLKNHRAVVVRINERGPFGAGRIIDLSRAAAVEIGMIDDGVVPVTVEVVP